MYILLREVKKGFALLNTNPFEIYLTSDFEVFFIEISSFSPLSSTLARKTLPGAGF